MSLRRSARIKEQGIRPTLFIDESDSDNENDVVAKVPPRKRAKTSGRDSSTITKVQLIQTKKLDANISSSEAGPSKLKRTRKAGKLALLPQMPLDVLYQVRKSGCTLYK
jgi:hypothetical protein